MVTKMVIAERRAGMQTEKRQYDAWLVIDGTPVSFARLMDSDAYQDYICICTVETREAMSVTDTVKN